VMQASENPSLGHLLWSKSEPSAPPTRICVSHMPAMLFC
jgi:hypothetical protein